MRCKKKRPAQVGQFKSTGLRDWGCIARHCHDHCNGPPRTNCLQLYLASFFPFISLFLPFQALSSAKQRDLLTSGATAAAAALHTSDVRIVDNLNRTHVALGAFSTVWYIHLYEILPLSSSVFWLSGSSCSATSHRWLRRGHLMRTRARRNRRKGVRSRRQPAKITAGH